MNVLLARLAASGAISGIIVGSLGGPALAADGSHIGFTGPNSRNIIASQNANRLNQNINNAVRIDNRNDQQAFSGNVLVAGNNRVGSVGGSGDAINSNRVSNSVNIANPALKTGFGGPGFGHGNVGPGGSITNTGPGSDNLLKFKNSNRINQNIRNDVNIQNLNKQTAVSGDVKVVDNNRVGNVGGSGTAANFNQTSNRVNIR
jgi:hypothetical protein